MRWCWRSILFMRESSLIPGFSDILCTICRSVDTICRPVDNKGWNPKSNPWTAISKVDHQLGNKDDDDDDDDE